MNKRDKCENIPAVQSVRDSSEYECARDGVGPVADFEWFASDELGHVAVFSDGGTTWIPDRFSLGYGRYASLHVALANLPTTGTPLFERGAENFDPHGIVAAWSSKGFFVYDWPVAEFPNCIPNQPYRIVGRPSAPNELCAFDQQSREYLEKVRLRTVVFECSPRVLISRNT
jgi:hypothetical protein